MASRSYGLRSILFAIVVSSIVPALGFSGYLLWRFEQSEHARAALFLDSQTRGVATDIDAEFSKAIVMLEAIASVPALTSGDLRRIEATLLSVTARSGQGLVLSDAQGRVLVDTRPRGSVRLPISNTVFQGKPAISDVVATDGTAPVAVVAVPVDSGGTILALATALTVEDFVQVIRSSGVPADWIVSIVDRKGVHLARSHKVDEFAGKPLVPILIDRIRDGAYGRLESVSLEGIPLISAIVPAFASRWHAAVGLPRHTLEAPVQRSFEQLLLAGLAIAVLTMAVILLLGRRFDITIRALLTAARDLGAGRTVALPPLGIREAQAIGDELSRASGELAKRTAQIGEAQANLERKVEERTAELVGEMARREASEKQLRHMQRIESVGQLTGGIAHDFNNMLAVILASLQLLEKRLASGNTDVKTYIDGARSGAERAAALTRRLLAFSRQQALEPQVVDCNKLVPDASELLRRTIPENVEIETILAGGLWRTHIDPGQLENALVNLASNARDAMPDGGKLTIETANAHFDDAYALANPDAVAGQYVMIAVSDTGHGMDPAILGRAFEPFVTTKPVGQGTGLGLSQVYGFIKQSNGHVKIYSEPGHGVTVKLYLPRWFGADNAVPPSAPGEALPRSHAGELILMVEDEPDVRRLTVEMLETLGYRTRDAASGQEALDLLASLDGVSLLFTDIVMPGMNGRQLADRAVAARPDLKILFTTGYTRNAVVHNGIVDPGVQLIAKPFSLEALARKIEQVLRTPVR